MRSLLSAVFAVLLLTVFASSAPAAVVLNEVESQGGIPGDWVELTNNGAAPVDIGGYVVKDSGENNNTTIPGGTNIAAGGFYVVDMSGLGDADSARLFNAGAAQIDSYSWGTPAQTTYGSCPDGTGAFAQTKVSTRGAANDCSTLTAWPGSSSVSVVSDVAFSGTNLSGLAYQPSGTSAPGVLWAVRNNPGTLYRLLWNGSKWTPDTANGWSSGKVLHYPGGAGNPDAEGVTLAAGDPSTVYVATERDGDFNGTSRPAVLRFGVTGAAASLTAARDWNLTADLPGLGPNLGLEAVTWVPDSVLTAKGFVDDTTGAPYSPASYPGHGSGLFLVGVEQTGEIIAYAFDQATDTATKVSVTPSGFPSVMDLEFEPETGLLWAVCDDNCSGRAKTYDIVGGDFTVQDTYERPAGMANFNNEGFTLTPRAECAGSRKPAFWVDDTGPSDVLRAGKVRCTDHPPASGTTPVTPAATTSAATTPAGPAAAPPASGLLRPTVLPPRDTTAPVLTKLKASRKSVSFRLSEDATVTVTVERKVGKRLKRLKRFAVKLKRGARTVKLQGRLSRSKLRRGPLRFTVVGVDAAGNRSKSLRRTVRR